MRDRRDHAGAVVDEAAQAELHVVEGADRLAHVARAALGERRHRHVDAEALRRLGQRAERRRQAVQDPDGKRDDGHDHGADEHQRLVRPDRGRLDIGGGEVEPGGIRQLHGDEEGRARLVPRDDLLEAVAQLRRGRAQQAGEGIRVDRRRRLAFRTMTQFFECRQQPC